MKHHWCKQSSPIYLQKQCMAFFFLHLQDIDVIRCNIITWASWRIWSSVTGLYVQQHVNNNDNVSATCLFVMEFTDKRRVAFTISNEDDVSMTRRHHALQPNAVIRVATSTLSCGGYKDDCNWALMVSRATRDAILACMSTNVLASQMCSTVWMMEFYTCICRWLWSIL